MENIDSNISSEEELVGIDEVQKFLNRSRASVYRYTNTDLRNLNPSFNPRKLNPEFRTDQKAVSYTHLRAHETKANLVCRLLLEKKI